MPIEGHARGAGDRLAHGGQERSKLQPPSAALDAQNQGPSHCGGPARAEASRRFALASVVIVVMTMPMAFHKTQLRDLQIFVYNVAYASRIAFLLRRIRIAIAGVEGLYALLVKIKLSCLAAIGNFLDACFVQR
ncbi:MAG: hypothetical protein WBO24_14490 [Nitrospirales bacterium]